MALSTMNSSAKRMWQKFFLLFRIAVMSPHCSKTSRIISSVAFSGKPPTNTVLHPGGRSLVEGGGRSGITTKHKSFAFYWLALYHVYQAKIRLAESSPGCGTANFYTNLYSPTRACTPSHSPAVTISWSSLLSLPTFISHLHFYTEWLCMSEKKRAHVSIMSFLFHNRYPGKIKGAGREQHKGQNMPKWQRDEKPGLFPLCLLAR